MDADPQTSLKLLHGTCAVPLLQCLSVLRPFPRDCGRADVVEEMEKCAEDAKAYYHASGDIFKHVGILRAAEIYWNKERSHLKFS